MIGALPMCMSCTRLAPTGLKCEAHQDGIPDAIIEIFLLRCAPQEGNSWWSAEEGGEA